MTAEPEFNAERWRHIPSHMKDRLDLMAPNWRRCQEEQLQTLMLVSIATGYAFPPFGSNKEPRA